VLATNAALAAVVVLFMDLLKENDRLMLPFILVAGFGVCTCKRKEHISDVNFSDTHYIAITIGSAPKGRQLYISSMVRANKEKIK